MQIGVAFPLDETNMFKGTETIKDQNKANLINLLLTNPGERVYLPKYGVGIKNLLFEQQIDLELLKERIEIQTQKHISNIEIRDVRTGLSEDGHTLFLTIVYKSLLNGGLDSIQLNFK